MHPGELVGSRLPEALSDLTRRWAADHGVACTCQVTGDAAPLPPAVEVALFRAAQESLTNVARHASAGRVGVTLSYLDDTVLLDVRDDGSGFSPGATAPAFGLITMRERLEGVGGRLVVESTPGEGTAISASVQLGRAAPVAAAGSVGPAHSAGPGPA
jgi:signal transduction histidine kinase